MKKTGVVFIVLAIVVAVVTFMKNIYPQAGSNVGEWYKGVKNKFVSSEGKTDNVANAPFSQQTSSAESTGNIYTYKDKNGITIISNKHIPEEYKDTDMGVVAYKRDDPREIEEFQRQQRAAEDRGFAGWQTSQQNSQQQTVWSEQKQSDGNIRRYSCGRLR